MKSIGIIPLRSGSKGIPNKNKKKLLGRPLYQWILGEAIFSNLDEIYVFTDDQSIIDIVNRDYSWTTKVRTWKRSEESATDTASTEFGMWELAEGLNFNFDIICLLQATSPLTSKDDINISLDKLQSREYDSSLTVVRSKRFLWSKEGNSLNYDFSDRPRRQDFEGLLIENGAVYTITKDVFIETKNRIGKRIGIVEMDEDTLIEIDEHSDWTIVEQLLVNRLLEFKKPISRINALVLDVDGVFTKGTVHVSGEGEFAKTFSLRDGMGLEIARDNNIEIIVITSENSPIVDQRIEKLGIKYYYKYVKDKFSLLTKVSQDLCIQRNEMAYIGDDINDLSNLLSVGWGMAPNDGLETVKQKVDLVLHSLGGDKAIREGVEFIINFNNRVK